MKRRYLWFVVMVILAMVLASCGGAGNAASSGDNAATTAPDANTSGGGAAAGPQVVITQEDAGKSVDVKVGQPVLVKLGADHDWKINVTPTFVMSKDATATLNADEQGLYMPKMNGRATVQATGTPVCLKSDPPCTDPQVQFNVTVVITQP